MLNFLPSLVIGMIAVLLFRLECAVLAPARVCIFSAEIYAAAHVLAPSVRPDCRGSPKTGSAATAPGCF